MVSTKTQIRDADDKVLADHKSEACFAHLPRMNEKLRSPKNHLMYWPHKNKTLKKEIGVAFVEELKLMGFKINQTGEDLWENGYRMEFADFTHGKRKFPSLSEIGVHLTALRYIDEYPGYIHKYFNLLDIDPKIDKLHAFQIAHICNVDGKVKVDPLFGAGHSLIASPMGNTRPFKDWKTIQKQAGLAKHTWNGVNGYSIMKLFANEIPEKEAKAQYMNYDPYRKLDMNYDPYRKLDMDTIKTKDDIKALYVKLKAKK